MAMPPPPPTLTKTQEKTDAIMEDLMERKGRIVDSLMIEMLLSFIVSKDLDGELKHFSIMWMTDKIRVTHKPRTEVSNE